MLGQVHEPTGEDGDNGVSDLVEPGQRTTISGHRRFWGHQISGAKELRHDGGDM